jgi:hypothetical protein
MEGIRSLEGVSLKGLSYPGPFLSVALCFLAAVR